MYPLIRFNDVYAIYNFYDVVFVCVYDEIHLFWAFQAMMVVILVMVYDLFVVA